MQRRFCGQCGHLLWEPCLKCGEQNPVDEKYCGNCGEGLAASLAECQGQLAALIAEVDSLAEQGRFLDAMQQLEPVTIADHSQLQALAQQIRERLERFPHDRQLAIQRSTTAVADAEALLAQHRYDEAHRHLTSIPPAFRSQEIKDLLAGVVSSREAIQSLRKRVKSALAARQYGELLPDVEKLLKLLPEDAKLRQLREQLSQREQHHHLEQATKLLKLAKKALAGCDYSQARAAVDKLPPLSGLSEELQKLSAAVQERVWLAEQLRSAPLASPALKAVADRLGKLQPHDQENAKLAEQIVIRLKKAAQQKTGKPIRWAKPPVENSLGVVVDQLELPAALMAAEKMTQDKAHSLLVAFGLALQGLGRAAVETDLAPREKKNSWLKKLSRRGKKAEATTAWGIELGSKSLKAVQLHAEENAATSTVVEYAVQPYDYSSGDGDERAARATAVQKFLAQHPLEGQTVVLSLPGTQTLGRFFDLPAPKPEKFFEAVDYELRARIPLNAERLYFDYHWSELPHDNEQDVPRRRVVLVAAEKMNVDQRLQLFAEAKAAKILVQSDCVALCNAVHQLAGFASDAPKAVLNVGAATSDFVVITDSTFWFRGLFQGTNAFDKVIATALQKTSREAELLRRNLDKQPALHEVDALLRPEFATLAEEIHKTLRRYHNEMQAEITDLLLCGAGSQQFGLLRHLQAN